MCLKIVHADIIFTCLDIKGNKDFVRKVPK